MTTGVLRGETSVITWKFNHITLHFISIISLPAMCLTRRPHNYSFITLTGPGLWLVLVNIQIPNTSLEVQNSPIESWVALVNPTSDKTMVATRSWLVLMDNLKIPYKSFEAQIGSFGELYMTVMISGESYKQPLLIIVSPGKPGVD